MTLLEFCKLFVGCNTIVCLYTEDKKRSGQGDFYTEYKCVWRGMEWQINYSLDEESYFESHTDVEKCPFKDKKVKKVIGNIDSDYAEIDKISVVIEQ